MKRVAMHLGNYAGYLSACGLVGYLIGRIFRFLFKDFLTDEDYAQSNPVKYLLGVFGILAISMLLTTCVILYPLEWIRNKLESKIDDFADDKEWE